MRKDQVLVEDDSRWHTVALHALFKQEPGYQNNSWGSEGGWSLDLMETT